MLINTFFLPCSRNSSRLPRSTMYTTSSMANSVLPAHKLPTCAKSFPFCITISAAHLFGLHIAAERSRPARGRDQSWWSCGSFSSPDTSAGMDPSSPSPSSSRNSSSFVPLRKMECLKVFSSRMDSVPEGGFV